MKSLSEQIDTIKELPRVNRKLTCIITGKTVLVKPDKYARLYAMYGSDSKIRKNFVCFEVEKAIRNRNLKFWIENSADYENICNQVRGSIQKFNQSGKGQPALLRLHNELKAICAQLGTVKFEILPSQNRQRVVGLRVTGVSFVGELVIRDTP